MIRIECPQCGTMFDAHACRIERGQGKFCSIACVRASRSTKISCICLQCGKPFTIKKSQSKRGGKYCSVKCRGEAKSGANSPLWRGGAVGYYGANWHRQRDLAYERDGGVCQVCNRKPHKGEREFEVHHIVKRRQFNNDDLRANDLNNLITLCRQCHMKAEHGKIPIPVYLL